MAPDVSVRDSSRAHEHPLAQGGAAPERAHPSRARAYGVAFAASLAAIALKLTVFAALEPGFTTLFIAAVALSAWYGGLGPGVAATGTLSLAAAYFLYSPAAGSAFGASLELARVLVFGAVGLFVSSLSAAVRRAQRRAEASGRAALDELAQRVLAEDALSVSEAHNRLIVESVREYAIFTLDTEGRVATWSTGAARLFGYDTEEARSISLASLCSGDTREDGDAGAILRQARETGVYQAASRHVKADGAEFFAECTISPLIDTDEALVGYVAFVRDRTQARATEHRIRALNEGYREFVTWTSHEISEPARRAETLLDYLSQSLPTDASDETRALADGARSNVARIKSLLQSLRMYETIAEERAFTRVDVGGVVARLVRSGELATLVDERDADIVIGTLPDARGDEGLVERVFAALIENAIIHNPNEAPRVEITGEVDGRGRRVFIVRDNGPGIPAHGRANAFRAFPQGTDATRASTRPGMGLTLAESAVIAMDGDIEIRDPPAGRGCAVCVTLPAPPPRKPGSIDVG